LGLDNVGSKINKGLSTWINILANELKEFYKLLFSDVGIIKLKAACY